ncbi:MAG: ribonuclease R [Candidatus Taylorbacteria bacterium]
MNKNTYHNHKGVISTTQKGAGYIDDPDPKKESVYIEPGKLNTALNGDTVEFTVMTKKIRGVTTKIGEVTKVIQRSKELFVGTVNDGLVVVADDRKMYVSISVVAGKAKKDDKVYVRMKPWTDPKKNPVGEIVRILGQKGINDVEMESIVLDKGFEIGFPAAVEKEAEAIEADKASIALEISKRRDMRGVLTFTIDPFDAKDFDDAISFKKLDGAPSTQLYEIGVHIADVSHYVREGSALDKEAVKRGCSIYLVDRTIPMLPEVLSNDVCSLNPHEDKLTFSAIFTIDEHAKVHSRWFGRTVINSDQRFTYENAQEVIDGKSGTDIFEGAKYHDELVTLNRLAKTLRKQNASQGAIEFEQEEIKFRLDEKGKPIGVYAKERLDTHKLVEEYMLLANREVAKYIFDSIKKKGKRDTGAIYRIHDVPDKEKIANLATFVKALGYELRLKNGEVTAHDINHLLDQIEDTPHESLIRTATIRSMQKAVYSTKNVGHFGLAFSFYTHFTSPIRRYPDLLVQRILARHLKNEPFGDREIVALQKMAESSTEREINASEAERASKKLKQVEYMSERVGQVFEGNISGVTKWGIYVQEKETKSEGMIPISKIGTDYFVFNDKTYSIVGEKTKQKFTLGDAITFKVISADLDKKILEFAIING